MQKLLSAAVAFILAFTAFSPAALAAVAFDTSGGVTSGNSLSLTVGSTANRVLLASTWNNANGAITGSFNSVAMTQSPSVTIQSGYFFKGLYLLGPSSGTNSLTTTGTTNGAIVAASYTGVEQVTPASTTATSGGTSVTATINTARSGCWMTMFVLGNNGTPTAGTNATARTIQSSSANAPSVFDSNGPITTGGYSMTVNGLSSGQNVGAIAYLLCPAATATSDFGTIVLFN